MKCISERLLRVGDEAIRIQSGTNRQRTAELTLLKEDMAKSVQIND